MVTKIGEVLLDLEKLKTAILVGGSGLYLNAVINGLAPIPRLTEEIKSKFIKVK